MLRIGRRAIVSFPNFGHWRVRLARRPAAAACRSPTRCRYSWYDTPNIHLCTIRDFLGLAAEIGATIERGVVLDGRAGRCRTAPAWVLEPVRRAGGVPAAAARLSAVASADLLLEVAEQAPGAR